MRRTGARAGRWSWAIAAAVLVAACGGDDGGSTTTASTTTVPATSTSASTSSLVTTTTTPPPPSDFAAAGPFAAGVRTISLGDRELEVWYPVDPGDVVGLPTEVFDTLSVFPPELAPLIPTELQGEVDTGAYRDASAAALPEPTPLVVYSHGFGGYRQVATAFTTHLASWGYVVASVDHLERGLAAQATGTLGGPADQDVTDVRNALEALASDPELAPLIDFDRVAVTGHSAGSGTAVRATAQLEAVDAFVSISGGLPVSTDGSTTGVRAVTTSNIPSGTYVLTVESVDATGALVLADDGPGVTVPVSTRMTVPAFGGTVTLIADDPALVAPGTITFTLVVPVQPGLVVAADGDQVIPPDRSRELFDALPNDERIFVEIAGAGHNSFTDSCAGIVELGGLGSLAPLIGADQVARAEDGCLPTNTPPEVVQAVLDHYAVAFLRLVFGQPVDLSALTADAVRLVPGATLADFHAGP